MRVAWLLLLIGCGRLDKNGDSTDASNGGASCHSTADCTSGLDCLGPDEFPGCGIAPMQACASDSDCPGGSDRCHAVDDECSPDGIGSVCRPACTTDAECGSGFACPSGACVAVLCNAGATCPARQICDPSRITSATPVYDRTHGCFDVSCTTDADCGSRPCVNSTCQDSLGQCKKSMPVP